MAFRFPVRVYFSDTDAGGIVYHGRYLDFAEHARTELFRKACSLVAERDGDASDEVSQRELLSRDTAFVVKSVSIDYKKPGLLDDLLEVVTEIEDCKRFSMTFLQQVTRDGEVLAELRVRVASISVSTHRPQLIPSWLPEIIEVL
ncbi:MAG: YbgC/FadM family acyl-CoA thioesterase [Sphaerochaetaceae bacterium]|jgi:acyl-CoA thioester hydrolase